MPKRIIIIGEPCAKMLAMLRHIKNADAFILPVGGSSDEPVELLKRFTEAGVTSAEAAENLQRLMQSGYTREQLLDFARHPSLIIKSKNRVKRHPEQPSLKELRKRIPKK